MSQASTTFPTITNAMTVDVEDYFQVSAFAKTIDRKDWDAMPCRVEQNVDLLLNLFAENHAHGTFFVLGWIAERYPSMVKRIAAAGHELASHGYGHLRATEQGSAGFAADIQRAKQLLEEISGCEIRGYRAPSFSIDTTNPWAFDAILEAGYSYSSSVYPVKHDHYGMPNAPRFPYRSRTNLVEIPITTVRTLGRNFPAGGGGFFRLLPYRISKMAINKVNSDDRMPAIFYMHPWEVDPDQPRIEGIGLKSRFRHYVNLSATESRVRRLTQDFRWDRIDRVFSKAFD